MAWEKQIKKFCQVFIHPLFIIPLFCFQPVIVKHTCCDQDYFPRLAKSAAAFNNQSNAPIIFPIAAIGSVIKTSYDQVAGIGNTANGKFRCI